MMRPLFKTTIVIWSEYDAFGVELSDLAREADTGDAYCSTYGSERIEDPSKDKDWDGTEFFDNPDEADDVDPWVDPNMHGAPGIG